MQWGYTDAARDEEVAVFRFHVVNKDCAANPDLHRGTYRASAVHPLRWRPFCNLDRHLHVSCPTAVTADAAAWPGRSIGDRKPANGFDARQEDVEPLARLAVAFINATAASVVHEA
jgi:hypothetical protein